MSVSCCSDVYKRQGNYKAVVSALLEEAGLNYGALPKGLLKFHKYEEGSRTPLEEHLAEGAMYAAGKCGKVNVHFTVSTEHRELFKVLVAEKAGEFAQRYGVDYNITCLLYTSPLASLKRSPLGVNTNTSSSYRSILNWSITFIESLSGFSSASRTEVSHSSSPVSPLIPLYRQ